MPGFRDFERAIAAVLYGHAREDKGIFDVWVQTESVPFGVSCKMAAAQPVRNRSSFMELSNSAAKFKAALASVDVNYETEPELAGPIVVDLVMSWHEDVSDEIDLGGSRYAVLSHDSTWTTFQVLSFPLDLTIASPTHDVDWRREGRALNGYIDDGGRTHRLWQWYPDSGGQLKSYPRLSWADWTTIPFQLEEPPTISLRSRAIDYFDDWWPESMVEAPAFPETPTT